MICLYPSWNVTDKSIFKWRKKIIARIYSTPIQKVSLKSSIYHVDRQNILSCDIVYEVLPSSTTTIRNNIITSPADKNIVAFKKEISPLIEINPSSTIRNNVITSPADKNNVSLEERIPNNEVYLSPCRNGDIPIISTTPTHDHTCSMETPSIMSGTDLQ